MKHNKIARSKKILETVAVVSLAQMISAGTALAVPDSNISVEPPTVSIYDVLTRVRNYFLGAVIITCVFMILWGAFNYTTSGGDEKKVETAKKTIYYAVIGLVVALLAMAIVNLTIGMVKG